MPAPRATEATIARALRVWRAQGLTVGAVEVCPDGTVRIIAPQSVQAVASDAWDRRLGIDE